MRYILLFLLAVSLYAKDKTYIIQNFDCVEIAGTEYTGQPDSTGQRYMSNGMLTYEFDDTIVMHGIGDTIIYDQAKKVTIKYWKNDSWHSKNVTGKLYKPKKKYPLIGKKEKMKNAVAEKSMGK